MNLKRVNLKYVILTVFSFIVCFSIFTLIRIHFAPEGGDYGIDVYYHIKAAEVFPFISTTKIFPWVEMSIWKTHFYDKELGFHFILFLLQKVQNLLGVSKLPPFNIAGLFLAGTLTFLITVFSWIKYKNTAYLTPALFIFLSPIFFQKILMIRPHLISILLFSTTIFVLVSKLKESYKLLLVFFLGWLYSICYSIPLFIVMPVVISLMTSLYSRNKKEIAVNIKLIITALAGVIAGLTLHPQFPNTFIISYIQIYFVFSKILGLSPNSVSMATELAPPTIKTLYYSIPLFIVFLLNIIMFIKTEKNKNICFLFALNCFLLFCYFISERSIEYLLPSEIICFIAMLSHYRQNNFKFSKDKFIIPVSLIISAFILLPLCCTKAKQLLKLPTPCYDFGAWQKKHLPPNSYIALLNWGDFPRLFYVTDNIKYSSALDPMFSYYLYPKRTTLISAFLQGANKNITPQMLSKAFDTNLIYIPNFYTGAALNLKQKGAKIKYRDSQGFLLEL